jgi:hypothetical protein
MHGISNFKIGFPAINREIRNLHKFSIKISVVLTKYVNILPVLLLFTCGQISGVLQATFMVINQSCLETYVYVNKVPIWTVLSSWIWRREDWYIVINVSDYRMPSSSTALYPKNGNPYHHRFENINAGKFSGYFVVCGGFYLHNKNWRKSSCFY